MNAEWVVRRCDTFVLRISDRQNDSIKAIVLKLFKIQSTGNETSFIRLE